MSQFAGQLAVITGGSSGIGFGVAKRFLQLQGRVLLIARNADGLRTAAEGLSRSADARHIATACADVTDESSLLPVFRSAGRIDHLVTAAGPMPKDAPTLQVSLDAARELFDGKYWGQLKTARCAAPQMGATSSITMFSGTLARKPMGGVPIFASIDGAIESLGRVMAIDLSPIRVNVVAPGIVDTPMLGGNGPAARAAMVDAYASRVLVGRAGHPDDIASVVTMLMSNTFITGAVVDADGGKR